VLLHALYWIHANRAMDKIIPFTDQAEKNPDTVKNQVWLLYKGLKNYKQNRKRKEKTRMILFCFFSTYQFSSNVN
jgi:hypothetical protein